MAAGCRKPGNGVAQPARLYYQYDMRRINGENDSVNG